MKTVSKTLMIIALISLAVSLKAQINTKVTTNKGLKNSNISSAFKPAVMGKGDKDFFENKSVKGLKTLTVKEMKVPDDYFNKKIVKRWTITPKKPWGHGRYGDVGIIYKGIFHYGLWFRLQRNFVGNRADAFVGRIEGSLEKNKQYLITIKSHMEVKRDEYINIGVNTQVFKVPSTGDRTFAIVVKTAYSSRITVHISALHKEGESERYPEDLLISQILIDEI